MLLNVAVTAIIPQVSCPAYTQRTFTQGRLGLHSQSTGLINGIATILLTILIDPHFLLSDKSLRGEIRLERMNQIYGCMLVSRLFGTLLAQLLLIPFAYWIGWIVSICDDFFPEL